MWTCFKNCVGEEDGEIKGGRDDDAEKIGDVNK